MDNQKRGCVDLLALVSKYRGAVMGFAALWILVFHMWEPILAGVPVLGVVEDFFVRMGFGGVDIFFFLSGVGLIHAIGRGSLGSFYLRRAKKLLPPFLATALISARWERWSLGDFLGNITGFSFYARDVLSFLWFVPAIGTLYLLFPLYHRFFRRSRRKGLFFLGSLACWLGLSLGLRGILREDFYLFTNRIPIFLAGVYCGWRGQNGGLVMPRAGWPIPVLALGAGILLGWLTNVRGMTLLVPVSDCFLPTGLLGLSLTALLPLLLEGSPRWLRRGLTGGLSFLGAISLELYCVQERLGSVAAPILVSRVANPLLSRVLLLAAVTAAGFALNQLIRLGWKLWEKLKNTLPGKKRGL